MVQKIAIKGLQTLEQMFANSAGTNSTDSLPFKIIRPVSNSRYIPITFNNLLISGHKVADQYEDAHQLIFCHRYHIAPCNFCNSQTSSCCSIEINVVRSNAGC
eukprot:Gb_15378 [translate_table: standard]